MWPILCSIIGPVIIDGISFCKKKNKYTCIYGKNKRMISERYFSAISHCMEEKSP
jgi:hypothetical protein